MSVPTLYGISAELLNLMAEYEDIAHDVMLDASERATMLVFKENQIREQVTGLVKKVDGAAFYLREFSARAAAAKAEKDRNRDREHMWEARGERLKEYIIAVMQMMGKTRLDGDSNTLRLQKCPPSVEIAQPELVPVEYCNFDLRLNVADLITLKAACRESKDPEAQRLGAAMRFPERSRCEPQLTPIKEALKQQIRCEHCDGGPGLMMVQTTDGNTVPATCTNCNGTGKVNQGVPGCSLREDKMSLRVE